MPYQLNDKVVAIAYLKAGGIEVRKGTQGKVVDFGSRSGDPIVQFSTGVEMVCHPTHEVTLLSCPTN